MTEITLPQILKAREDRANMQKDFLEKYHCSVISFTMNIAGPVKTSPLIERAFRHGLDRILGKIEPSSIFECHIATPSTGCEAIIAADVNAVEFKNFCVGIEEETLLGRLFDIDVIDGQRNKLERANPRGCIVCGAPGRSCSARRVHQVDEIRKVTYGIMYNFFKNHDGDRIEELAVKCLIDEVSTTPKPGLVDRRNNGSHADMDINTFIKSAAALRPYFKECFIIGAENKEKTHNSYFELLRDAGIKAERTMYNATGGVNTHKGIIYSLGIICGCIGRKWSAEVPFAEIGEILKECSLTASCTAEEDFKNTGTSTAGGKAYKEFGIKGARGEASSGFTTVSNVGLPVLKKALGDGLDFNMAGVITLIHLIANVGDTNLYSRGGVEGSKFATEYALSLTDRYPTPEEAEKMDDLFISRNLSPGGCADLLAITYFLYSIYN